MRKFLYFTSRTERYKCEAAVVWCFDNRFELVLRKLLKRLNVEYFDPIRIAGGTKCLASPEHERDRDFLLEQIRISMRLHDTKSVILMLHSDCGAYGGLAAFEGNAEKEAQHHCLELQRASSYLLSQIPELTVQPFFVDFEGVWQVDAQGAQSERIA
ncbi:MAG TPA: carbonic anhydrase [Candidatus Angelobacter sp.]|nr:carbonic anhydrase [Candidatus Angelobacter sp.]